MGPRRERARGRAGPRARRHDPAAAALCAAASADDGRARLTVRVLHAVACGRKRPRGGARRSEAHLRARAAGGARPRPQTLAHSLFARCAGDHPPLSPPVRARFEENGGVVLWSARAWGDMAGWVVGVNALAGSLVDLTLYPLLCAQARVSPPLAPPPTPPTPPTLPHTCATLAVPPLLLARRPAVRLGGLVAGSGARARGGACGRARGAGAGAGHIVVSGVSCSGCSDCGGVADTGGARALGNGRGRGRGRGGASGRGHDASGEAAAVARLAAAAADYSQFASCPLSRAPLFPAALFLRQASVTASALGGALCGRMAAPLRARAHAPTPSRTLSPTPFLFFSQAWSSWPSFLSA